jgi:sortase (surface protein transpeptidase)
MTLRGAASRAAVPVVAAAVAAVLVIVGYLGLRGDRDDRGGRWDRGGPATTIDPSANPFGTPAAALSGTATRLRVPAIGVDTRLETLRLGADGELLPPHDFGRAGWYAGGTAPGDVGPAVIAGHVDSRRGPAVFFKLRELGTGDTIEVTRGGSTVRFTVVSTAWYPKTSFPTEEVYGPTPDRQLRLITCGGVFDRSLRSYKDNLVVYAVA